MKENFDHPKKEKTMNTTKQTLMELDHTILNNFRIAILENQRSKTLTQLLNDLSSEDAELVKSIVRMTRIFT